MSKPDPLKPLNKEPGTDCPKCGEPAEDTGGGTYACSANCGWWV